MTKIYHFAACCLFLSASTCAHGALLSIDDATFGTDAVTLDTVTGLEWLDLTMSQGRSYNDVATQFGASGDYAGWRHATFTEVQQLYDNAGISSQSGVFVLPPDPAVLQLRGLVGITVFNPFQLNSFGYLDNEGLSNDQTGAGLLGADSRFGSFQLVVPTKIFVGDGDATEASTGNWLVRPTAIPEPTSLAIWALGLVMVLGIRRRKPVCG